MAAKEPTVERRHHVAALGIIDGPDEPGASSRSERLKRAAQALAAAEQTSAERAWDEGWTARYEYQFGGTTDRPANPYRLPKGDDEVTDIRDTQVYRETKRRLDALQESTKCDRVRCIGMLDAEFADHYKAQRAALDALFREETK